MSLTRQSLAELARNAEAELQLAGADDALRRNLFTPLARAVAGGIHGLYGHQDWIARQLFPESCDDDTLLNVHAPFWLPGDGRKAASAAAGSIVLTGNPGKATGSSDTLSRSDGMLYALTGGGVIGADGQLLASVVCLTPGQNGNTEPGGKLTLVNPIAGINGEAIVQSPGLSGGADIEDIERLRARVVNVRSNGAQVGRASDWELWALEVPGVTRAWAAPKLMGAGSITVFFMRDGDADPYPDSNEQATVRAHLEATGTPWGEIFAASTTRKPVDMSIRLLPDNADSRAAVSRALTALLQREAAPVMRDKGQTVLPATGVTIPRSHISEAISAAAGEYDHSLIVPATDVVCLPGEMAELGVITWL